MNISFWEISHSIIIIQVNHKTCLVFWTLFLFSFKLLSFFLSNNLFLFILCLPSIWKQYVLFQFSFSFSNSGCYFDPFWLKVAFFDIWIYLIDFNFLGVKLLYLLLFALNTYPIQLKGQLILENKIIQINPFLKKHYE